MTVCYKALVGLAVSAVALAVTGCGGGSPKDVVLVTHDSFVIPASVKKAFEHETGLKLRILQSGDAGQALAEALLTAGNPQGDVFFGVDNNLLSRALAGNLFDTYTPNALEHVDAQYELDPSHHVVPVDHSEVCVVYDRRWFAGHDIPPPRSLEDLAVPRYRGLTVVENPATSTPGLAFLLATIAYRGYPVPLPLTPNPARPAWQGYWKQLRANKVLVTDGWEEAYNAEFSAHKGKRPIVVSYSTDPAAEVYFAGKRLARSPVAVVPGTCFRQIEFAGVLRGAHNEKGARELVDFMLSRHFQAGMPLTMFVLPTREGVPVPAVFRRYAPSAGRTLQLSPRKIGANRDRWVKEWTDIVIR